MYNKKNAEKIKNKYKENSLLSKFCFLRDSKILGYINNGGMFLLNLDKNFLLNLCESHKLGFFQRITYNSHLKNLNQNYKTSLGNVNRYYQ